MKVGILGSGNVGQALAGGFIMEGHSVTLATRDPDNDKARGLRADFPEATIGSFADAAAQAELVVLCTPWDSIRSTLELAGADNLAGTIIIDANNIITQENDVPVYGGEGTSAAEQIQEWLPDSRIVKAFNTVGANMMYRPQLSPAPTMFIAGDDEDAKQTVAGIITSFGWEPLDSGPLICARELEAMALVWIRNSMASGRGHAFKML